jgi:hypothetical protein
MEVVPGDVLVFQISHLAVGDLDAFGVDGLVELGGDGQAGAGSTCWRLTGLTCGWSTPGT